MYCRKCGKQIADDSLFCQYCGGKVYTVLEGNSASHNNCPIVTANNDNESRLKEQTNECIIETKKANPIQVEVSKKSNNNKSVIANEIVGNLKMIGLAFVVFSVYMIFFILKHQKDITSYDYETRTSYFGESCYDPSYIEGNWKFNWEQHYYETLYYRLNHHIPPYGFEQLTPEQCLIKAEALEEEWNKKRDSIAILLKNHPKQPGVVSQLELEAFELEESFEEIEKYAKIQANRDIQEWNNKVNDYRKYGYEKDLKKNALYSAFICLALTIIGRYLFKLIKWVTANKSKN